jgi:beta-glucosidase
MKHLTLNLLFAFSVLVVLQSFRSEKPLEDDIDKILKEMTLEEKIGQMTNLTLSTIASDSTGELILDKEKVKHLLKDKHVG